MTTTDTQLSAALEMTAIRLANMASRASEIPPQTLADAIQEHAYELSARARQARESELHDGSRWTTAQQVALARMVANNLIRSISFRYEQFDLPKGFIAFAVEYADGPTIYGGIAPDGAVST